MGNDDEIKERGNGVSPLFPESNESPKPSSFQSQYPDIGFFDPTEPITNLTGNLPHWRQENTTYFVTFRLADSLPRERLKQWQAEKEQWLKAQSKSLTKKQKAEFYRLFPERMQKWLDAGQGSCILARSDFHQLVSGALRYFHGERYHLDEYAVAANHVHVIVTPAPENELSSILHSWKSYTSHKINKMLGRSGEIWQKESFDHIIRSEESLLKFRNYIRGHRVNSGETPLPLCAWRGTFSGSLKEASVAHLSKGKTIRITRALVINTPGLEEVIESEWHVTQVNLIRQCEWASVQWNAIPKIWTDSCCD